MKVAPIFSTFLLGAAGAAIANAQDVPGIGIGLPGIGELVSEFAKIEQLTHTVTIIINELGGPEVAAEMAMASANQAGTVNTATATEPGINTATAAEPGINTATAISSSSSAITSEPASMATELAEGDMGSVIEDIILSNQDLQWLRADSGEARGIRPPSECIWGRGCVPLPIIQAILCIIISIIVDNVLYAELPSLCDYSDNEVCLDSTADCGTDKSTPMIEFVRDDANRNEFLYADARDGLPTQLQGVFWLDYDGYCSSIVSWAKTKEGFPLSEGELRNPLFPILAGRPGLRPLPGFRPMPVAPGPIPVAPGPIPVAPGPILLPPGPLYDGFEYSIRVSGASNWAFSTSDGCFDFVEDLDLIYGFRLLDGSLDDPKEFQVVPSVKIPGTCFRLSIDDFCLESAGIPFALLRFTMTLIENCGDLNNNAQNFDTASTLCASSPQPVIWERRSWFFADRSDDLEEDPPSDIYYVIQIIDGSGTKLPAYNDWVANQGDPGAPQPSINAFRSINKKSVKAENCWFAKSSKSSKGCKSSKGGKAMK